MTSSWADHATADPVADIRGAMKAIIEQSRRPREPHRHMFYGEAHLLRFLTGHSMCADCGAWLNPMGDRFVVCHPDEIYDTLETALTEWIPARPSANVAKGESFIVDLRRFYGD